ncbi:MAG: hypothetical protein M3Y49_20880 [Actinomycetota bacterium]|nr:hypothetical protein [Actinomycetota bacterium]
MTNASPRLLAVLSPKQQLHAGRMPRRLVQLFAGLTMYGLAMAMFVRSGLGLDPWDVFHYGIAQHLGLDLGTVIIAVSVLVLLLWIPLRQWPGLGTVANAIWIGIATNLTLAVIPTIHGLPLQIAVFTTGLVINGIGGALYLGAQLGPGPRDGLMTGLHHRTGISLRVVRTALELTVLVTGWLMGGIVGVGTVAYAVAIGPLVQAFLPRCIVTLDLSVSEPTDCAPAAQPA